ncbi:MAG: hypothetical protein R3Y63_14810 [Eubacteriales bacterium]
MSEKILQQLYYGKIEPVTKRMASGSEYQKQQKMISEAHEELMKKLDENDFKLLETIMEGWTDLDCIGNEERFIEGVNSFCYAKLLRSRRILRR